MRRLSLLLLVACGPRDDGGGETAAGDTAPAAVPLPDPAWDGPAVAQTINDAFALGLPDPTSILLEFEGMWRGADVDCPQTIGDYSMRLVLTQCYATTGFTYAGISTYEPGEGDDFWLLGDCSIEDDLGQVFTCGGEVERDTVDDGWSIRITGEWSYPGSETGWLAQANGTTLWMSKDAAGVHVDGAYALGDTDLFLQDVRVADGCATGAVWLRDPQGSWYVLTLDETCDACGEIVYGDLDLGSACVDLPAAVADLAARME